MINIRNVRPAIEKLFVIPNKAGEVVPFKLNNIQIDIDASRTGRDDILKFRQGGATSYIMAYFLVECMYTYTRAVMIAHDKEHTERLLARAQFYLQKMKGVKPRLRKSNDQEIVFQKTHSSLYIGTAGSRQFGRSDTITHLHCSEVAFWKNAKDLCKGLFQAVPHQTGIIIKESTANGMGTWHHHQYIKALQGTSRFKPHFYGWQDFDEYQSTTPKNFIPTPDEIELMLSFGLSTSKLQFRREKIADDFDGDEDAFRQEYPLTIKEAFILSGGSLFEGVERTETSRWSKMFSPHGGACFALKDHPMKVAHYVLGSDTAGGTGRDYSTIQIFCVETGEQVLEYRTNTKKPPEFANVVVYFGLKYNTAYIVVESNQHGLSVLSVIREQYTSGRIYKEVRYQKVNSILRPIINYGLKMTAVSKPFIVGLIQKYLRDVLTIYGIQTATELQEFTETESGKLEGPVDDLVIGVGCACVGLQKETQRLALLPSRSEIKEPVDKNARETSCTFEDIMSRIKAKREQDWFEDQHAAIL